jgi:hypothetical protein
MTDGGRNDRGQEYGRRSDGSGITVRHEETASKRSAGVREGGLYAGENGGVPVTGLLLRLDELGKALGIGRELIQVVIGGNQAGGVWFLVDFEFQTG